MPLSGFCPLKPSGRLVLNYTIRQTLLCVVASCVIIILKVSGKRIPPSAQGKSADSYVLYIIYIYNGNNDAMTQSNGDGGFLRVIIRVIFLFLPLTTRSATHPRHSSRTSHLPHSDFKFRIPGFGLPASSRQPVPSPTYRLSPCQVHGLLTSAVC